MSVDKGNEIEKGKQPATEVLQVTTMGNQSLFCWNSDCIGDILQSYPTPG